MVSQPDPDPLDVEVVDGVPVLCEDPVSTGPLAPAPPSPGGALSPVGSPAVQAAAAAATGFVAGAATLALVRRRSARRLARTTLRPRRVADALPIVGSRSFLVDVHLIAKPGE